jgi:hypothetical protein
LKCLVGDFLYIRPQDQDPYFYFNDGDDVWFMFFVLKYFTFIIFWYFV